MLKSNTANKIISVIIAILLWTYVIGMVDPTKTTTIRDVPVQLLNEDSLTSKGLALSGEMDYTVDIVVEGKRADLTNLSAADFTAEADLFTGFIGKNYIPIVIAAPDFVTVMDVRPNKIAVAIEELAVVNKPIRVVFTGQLSDEVEAGGVITQPEFIEVTGAKSEVDAVAYIKAQVNASRLSTEPRTIEAEAVAVNRDGDEVTNIRLSTNIISVTARLYNVKEVPLNVEITGQVDPIYESTFFVYSNKSVCITVKS
jgi:YbbR domain-containing protein